MKRIATILALTSALVLVLALLPAAPSATAFIACEDCEPDMSPYARCAGFCNGMWISFCTDWLIMGCNSLQAPDGETKEEFLASLNDTEQGTGFGSDGNDGDDDTNAPGQD